MKIKLSAQRRAQHRAQAQVHVSAKVSGEGLMSLHKPLTLSVLVALSACQRDTNLSVLGFASSYELSVELAASDCQEGLLSPSLEGSTGPLKLIVTQGEREERLLLALEGSKGELEATLCRAEEGAPQGLCLDGERLSLYQPALSFDESRCELWRSLGERLTEEACCEAINMGADNSLKLSVEGALSGRVSFKLWRAVSEVEAALSPTERLYTCGGPLSCHVSALWEAQAMVE